ncbi:MAG: NADH:ubiquinone oxidoreductase [Phycisphaerales bacterium]|nr:NAD(P)H-dependent oxidoreductase subunit E [Phycisphaerae bacterium]NNF43413.1 NADH:ubiquinone oxidoreductase [Phycisphaerales bacterium]NNM26424.1 NADH:ubiquinone oxidoreductase [Phycisphaerales bacterium]
MTAALASAIGEICDGVGRDPTRLLDVARAVQERFRCVSTAATDHIAKELGVPRGDVDGLVSFYAFLSREPKGRVVIRLSDDIIDRLHGFDRVRDAFGRALGIEPGQTTPDGAITLETTSCIGMCDQAPAALVNEVVVTDLSTDRAREIVGDLRDHMEPARLVRTFGDGNNAHDLVRAMVNNNIRAEGPFVLSELQRGEAVSKAIGVSPAEVIRAVKTARLRGRGGAGFPTGMKWEYARNAEPPDGSRRKFVICNADEGEPGTFKDRVILTERADRVLAGMTIAGYAIGAEEGILYLRDEYAYLQRYLEHLIDERRGDGLLGPRILGTDFGFDVRIQMGAGAYICGEETALINSCEGKRGDPRNRPPFPAQSGYLGCPTIVNNPETLCCVTKIIETGPATFCAHGSPASSGTKLLSVSGDCHAPGVYELPFGLTLRALLDRAGAADAAAVQVGGPSGTMVAPDHFDRRIEFDDLATGGAIMVFGPDRDILEIVRGFMDFFVHESCGYCTPCRVGNVILRDRIARIIDDRGEPSDLDELETLSQTIRATSRCGLGQTSPNPVLSTLESFRSAYEQRVEADPDGFRRSFDLASSVCLTVSPDARPSSGGREPSP